MNTPPSEPPLPFERSAAATVVASVLVLAVLYAGREFLIPVALAVLLSFLLAPPTRRLERWIGRLPAVGAITLAVFLGLGGVFWVVTRQVLDLAQSLPRYEENIRARVDDVRASGEGILARFSGSIRSLERELDGEDPAEAPVGPPESPAGPAPVPVRVVEPETDALDLIGSMLGPLLKPLSTAGIVIVFVMFMLVQRESLRDRFLRLAGTRRLNVTTQALDDAAGRISRFLGMFSLVNAIVGAAVGVGLWLLGVPNAALWGFLAAVLRFIPYVGVWIAGAMPVALSLAVSPGWVEPAAVVALIVVIEVGAAYALEPYLFGVGTGVSPMGILAAAVFWAWLWGPVGLVLATPLTVCLIVLGRYAPQLWFLTVLLADEPALSPPAHLYQRLLAQDEFEAEQIVTELLEAQPAVEVFDQVLIPALEMAERDRHHGDLSPERRGFVYPTLRSLVEELELAPPAAAGDRSTPTVHEPRRAVVCLPARDEADAIVAAMVGRLLEGTPLAAQLVGPEVPFSGVLERIERHQAGSVLISAVPPFAFGPTRRACARLRQALPGLRIIVGLWHADTDPQRTREHLARAGADVVATTLAQAVHALQGEQGSPRREHLPFAQAVD